MCIVVTPKEKRKSLRTSISECWQLEKEGKGKRKTNERTLIFFHKLNKRGGRREKENQRPFKRKENALGRHKEEKEEEWKRKIPYADTFCRICRGEEGGDAFPHSALKGLCYVYAQCRREGGR